MQMPALNHLFMKPILNMHFFFSVTQIIKPQGNRIIYGVHYGGQDYFILKSLGMHNCEQLDSKARLNEDVIHTMCKVITTIESDYKKTPPLEFINFDIYSQLVRLQNPDFD
jgi:hypothetical protein